MWRLLCASLALSTRASEWNLCTVVAARPLRVAVVQALTRDYAEMLRCASTRGFVVSLSAYSHAWNYSHTVCERAASRSFVLRVWASSSCVETERCTSCVALVV